MVTRTVAAALLLGGALAWSAAGRAAEPEAALSIASRPDGGVEVREGGSTLATIALATPAAKRAAARARVVRVDGRRLLEVRVPVRGMDRTELWLAELGAAAPKVVFHGQVGARDVDGETTLEVKVEPAGVTQHQSAARVARCDGEPARLFPRRYDFAAGRWQDLPPPLPAKAAVTLVARRAGSGMPAGRPRVRFPFTAASSSPMPGAEPDVRALGAPLALNDGDATTTWSEGSHGDGRGEFVTARSSGAARAVVGLRLLPGDTSSAAAFRAHGRPSALTLLFGATPEQRIDVVLKEDEPLAPGGHLRPFWVPLPAPVASTCVTVLIREVAPGHDAREREVTALGDIDVFTDLDGPQGLERLVDTLRADDCQPRVGDVVGLGAPALPKVAELLPATAGAGRECVVEVLATLVSETRPRGDAAAAVARVLPAAVRGASAEQERRLLAALPVLEEPPVAALAAALADEAVPVEERARVARALAALDRDDARAALLGSVGHGDPPLRAALRELVGGGRAGTAVLARALEETPAAEIGRRADLALCLGAGAGKDPDARGTARATLERHLAAKDEAFEVKVRALEGLGRLAGREAIAAIAGVRAGSDDPVLRMLAVRELARSAEPVALEALRAAIADGDPAARETAAQALGRRKDVASTPLLIAGAKQEPWPAVRRAEISALGQLCGPGAADLLVRALERDVDEVRRAAATGLVACRDGRAPKLLLAMVGSTRESASVRSLAATLLGELKDRTAAPALAAALNGLRVDAQVDLALEGVTVAVLRALAEIGGPDALAAVLAIANDPQPVPRGAALAALGRLCNPGRGAEVLRAAARDKDQRIVSAATAALRRCAGQAAPASGDRP